MLLKHVTIATFIMTIARAQYTLVASRPTVNDSVVEVGPVADEPVRCFLYRGGAYWPYGNPTLAYYGAFMYSIDDTTSPFNYVFLIETHWVAIGTFLLCLIYLLNGWAVSYWQGGWRKVMGFKGGLYVQGAYLTACGLHLAYVTQIAMPAVASVPASATMRWVIFLVEVPVALFSIASFAMMLGWRWCRINGMLLTDEAMASDEAIYEDCSLAMKLTDSKVVWNNNKFVDGSGNTVKVKSVAPQEVKDYIHELVVRLEHGKSTMTMATWGSAYDGNKPKTLDAAVALAGGFVEMGTGSRINVLEEGEEMRLLKAYSVHHHKKQLAWQLLHGYRIVHAYVGAACGVEQL